MYRLAEIQKALFHVVGFSQSYDPSMKIDDRLLESESGLTFQGAHPLMTLENCRAVMPESFILQYPAWNMISEYKVGDKVRHDNKVWVAVTDNVNAVPGVSDFNKDYNDDYGSDAWIGYDMLNDWLTDHVNNGIASVVQKFVAAKQLNGETRNLMERRTFFDGAARLQSVIDNGSKIVGMEIVPVRSMGVTAKIERVGLQMVGAVGTVRIYIFHSSQTSPVMSFDCEFTNKSGGFQWFTPKEPVFLPYISNGTDSGGAWYLCYNQSDLPDFMTALNVTKDWSKDPCQTCTGGSIEAWRELTKYLQVSPFRVDAPDGFKESPEMWDISRNIYTNTMNYGINCEISVGCDISDFIISQRLAFADVIQKQVAYNILRTMAMNPSVRVNRNQANVGRMEILYELDGNTAGRAGGLGYELDKAYKAIVFDTRGLDRICLSCNNHGVRYRTI